MPQVKLYDPDNNEIECTYTRFDKNTYRVAVPVSLDNTKRYTIQFINPQVGSEGIKCDISMYNVPYRAIKIEEGVSNPCEIEPNNYIVYSFKPSVNSVYKITITKGEGSEEPDYLGVTYEEYDEEL